MGTLLNQSSRDFLPVRFEEVQWDIDAIKDLATKTNLTFDQVLKVCELKEKQRTNTLSVRDGDAKDEQLAGFGELLREFNDNISQIVEFLQENK